MKMVGTVPIDTTSTMLAASPEGSDMRATFATAPFATAPIAPGTVLGTAQLHMKQGATAPVTAGATLATGVRDIKAAAEQLRIPGSFHTEAVGFIRRGDTWDAVQMLMPSTPGGEPKIVYGIRSHVSAMAVTPGIELDAIWDIGYAQGDARFGSGADGGIRRL